MNIKMNRNMGRVLLAGACAAALAVGSAVPAFAAEQTGTTNVTYSSSTQVPGTNGWGFEIPTAIPFGQDKSVTVDASVSLYNTTPGASVGQITTLPAGGAKLYLKSANGFKLMTAANGDGVDYQIVYEGTAVGQQPKTFDKAITDKTEIGTFTIDNYSATGTATRMANAMEGGAHTDTLTFSFDDSTGA